jgi:hypothetical protein
MSLYSQGMDLRQASTGFPFCLGETRMEDPEPRAGRAWGVGCTTLGGPELEAFDGGARSRRCGVGCWILGAGRGGAAGPDGRGCAAARAARTSSASPYSSSSIFSFALALMNRCFAWNKVHTDSRNGTLSNPGQWCLPGFVVIWICRSASWRCAKRWLDRPQWVPPLTSSRGGLRIELRRCS